MAAHIERPAAAFLDGLIAPKKAEVERQIEIVPIGGPPILSLGLHLKILHAFGMQVTYFDCQIGTSHLPSGSGLFSAAIPTPLAGMSVSVKKPRKSNECCEESHWAMGRGSGKLVLIFLFFPCLRIAVLAASCLLLNDLHGWRSHRGDASCMGRNAYSWKITIARPRWISSPGSSFVPRVSRCTSRLTPSRTIRVPQSVPRAYQRSLNRRYSPVAAS
jgi:hypothetical protein